MIKANIKTVKFRNEVSVSSKCNCGTCNCNCGSGFISANIKKSIENLLK